MTIVVHVRHIASRPMSRSEYIQCAEQFVWMNITLRNGSWHSDFRDTLHFRCQMRKACISSTQNQCCPWAANIFKSKKITHFTTDTLICVQKLTFISRSSSNKNILMCFCHYLFIWKVRIYFPCNACFDLKKTMNKNELIIIIENLI